MARYERNQYSDKEKSSATHREKRKTFTKRKACRFCSDIELKADFKNPKFLSSFLSERYRLVPRRISGNCALHQRRLTSEVKRARIMALLPFTETQR